MTQGERVSESSTSLEAEKRSTIRLLAPLDGSELAAKALPIAEFLCRQLGAELHLVRALQSVALPFTATATYIPPDVYAQLQADQDREAREYLDQVAKEAREHGVGGVVTHVEWGDAASAVLDLAAQLHPTLIVMTTHGRTGLARFALGSVADRIVRGGEAPVLLLRSFADSQATTTTAEQTRHLSHALIPLDGSPLAEEPVFSIALQLAGPVLRSITLLRVTDPREGMESASAAEGYLEGVRRRLVDRLEGRDCVVTATIRVGAAPAQRILECASEEVCGLVMMSTHGEAGIGRLAFGSVTDRVLRDGQLPLLLVHPPKR